MTKPAQQRLRLLIILLIVLAATVYFGYRMNRTPNPAVVQAQEQKTAAAPPVQTDARIRLDLLDKQAADENLGKKNLFQYGPPPAPPAPPKPPAGLGAPGTNPAGMGSTPSNPAIPQQPVKPPPPPITLKYIGFAYIEPNSKILIASLADEAQHHFTASEGDVIMGRYRVGRISDTAVEVEDLEFSRKQSLPLVKQ